MKRFIRLLLLLGFLTIFLSCKKYSKELTTVNFHLYNPVTNEGFANVKVKIIQQEDVTGAFQVESKYESTVIWEGVTDAEGKATYSFNAMKKDKFTYWHSVDENFKAGKNLVKQPEYEPIKKNETNSLTYQVTKNVDIVKWIKNNSCFDQNDLMRYRYKSLIKNYDNWSSWVPSNPFNYYTDCFDLISPLLNDEQDILDIEMEVTKNGITSLMRDTFYLTGQNGTDTLKLFY